MNGTDNNANSVKATINTDGEFNPIAKPPPFSHRVTIAHRRGILNKVSVAGFAGSCGRCGVEHFLGLLLAHWSVSPLPGSYTIYNCDGVSECESCVQRNGERNAERKLQFSEQHSIPRGMPQRSLGSLNVALK